MPRSHSNLLRKVRRKFQNKKLKLTQRLLHDIHDSVRSPLPFLLAPEQLFRKDGKTRNDDRPIFDSKTGFDSIRRRDNL